jgi:hypothetical protein
MKASVHSSLILKRFRVFPFLILHFFGIGHFVLLILQKSLVRYHPVLFKIQNFGTKLFVPLRS